MTDVKKVKILVGEVVNASCDKTATVLISNIKSHRLYQKKFVVSRKFKVHDDKNECQVGDMVEIIPTRPISKEKKFRFVKKVK